MNTIIQKFSGTDLDISIGPVYDLSDRFSAPQEEEEELRYCHSIGFRDH